MYGKPSAMVPTKFLEIPNLKADRKIAHLNSLRNHEYNKQRYDKNRIEKTFAVGQKVFVENGNKLNRSKLDPIRIGPFPIANKLSNSIYEIDVGYKSCSRRLYHASKIVTGD